MSTELAPWEPAPFSGIDLVPLQLRKSTDLEVEGVPVIAEEDLEAEDMILPTMSVLQGQSKAVLDHVGGAQAGLLFFSASQEAIKPPVRLIIVHRFRGNAMFVRKGAEYEGLEDCISRDGVTGSKYGSCETCKKCTEWRGPNEDQPPLGSKTQQFVLLTSKGVCILRVSQSNKHSTKYTREFITAKVTAGGNWFRRLCVVDVSKETNPNNETYFVPRMHILDAEVVPGDVQKSCHEWYQRIFDALEAGKFSDTEETAAPTESKAGTERQEEPEIPF